MVVVYLHHTKYTWVKNCHRKIMVKESIHQEDLEIINIHALNIRVPIYMRYALTELREK